MQSFFSIIVMVMMFVMLFMMFLMMLFVMLVMVMAVEIEIIAMLDTSVGMKRAARFQTAACDRSAYKPKPKTPGKSEQFFHKSFLL